MLKDVLRVAFAFVGIIVGAGFASGQEVMQYYVGFGAPGLLAVALSAVVMSVIAMIILQLGSYFRAAEHGEVFDHVSHPVFSRALDIGVIITLFATGFVMFAGAGSNLNQQWGLPTWVGAVAMVVLVLLAGLVDVTAVTTIIGAITPFIIGFIILASLYVIAFVDHAPFAELDASARAIGSSLPHPGVAAVNYVGFNLMVAVSMAIVIGGTMFNPRVAGRGGFLGGLIFSVLLGISAVTLFLAIDTVGGDALPMLTLIDTIHPLLGQIMAVVIFGMIFNTALGMFYALAKRLSARRPAAFYRYYAATVVVGFVLSFAGFQKLVGFVYPILGYMGLLLIAVMIVAWVRRYRKIAAEADRRLRLVDLWRAGRSDEFQAESNASNLDDRQIRDAVDH
ncbi:YkvI family membrane protein [Corynebacterium uterequi]|uniref:Putative membrane protein n=1 Tax=Corynebacterium uterequi TaxID=1072256 RepID=A0A0G3HAE1_9CORY|nr:membrane protein [Corynebacterium uterequi]AKK10294.1 putative membrane protein [Corynebacterium uterequi]